MRYLLLGLLLVGGTGAAPPKPAAVLDAAAIDAAPKGSLRLVVRKGARRLELLDKEGRVLADVPVGLGFDPTGDKVRSGDGRTPEGEFKVTGRLPNSQFYKAFLLSYPEVEDADRGQRDGIVGRQAADAIRAAHAKRVAPPHDTALGGLVEIHGRGSTTDWTLGCVALDDEVIDTLWPKVPVGTRVTILP